MSARRFAHLAALTALFTASVTVADVGVHAPSASAAGEAAGEYHSVAPARILDTRPGNTINDVAPLGAKPTSNAGSSFDMQLLGVGGIPAADVLGVVVSITVAEPSNAGYLSAYPKGAAPTSSVVNFSDRQVVPNLAIVAPGTDGKVTVSLATPGKGGTAHVLVDVFGWFSSSTYVGGDPGARLVTLSPDRLLDTRPGNGGGGPIGAASFQKLPIRGNRSVPSSPDIVGVLLNVVAIQPTAATFVSVLPEDPVGLPATSNLNLAPGVVKANLVIVPVGADGGVRLYNSAGSTNVAVDVVGYLVKNQSPSTLTGRVIPLSPPFRTFDTRAAQFGATPLGPGQAEDWDFKPFADSVKLGETPVGAQSAVLGNFTIAGLTRQYAGVGLTAPFATVYPKGEARPNASNINGVEGAVVPNMAVLKYGTNTQVTVYNSAGNLHYVFDAQAVVLA